MNYKNIKIGNHFSVTHTIYIYIYREREKRREKGEFEK